MSSNRLIPFHVTSNDSLGQGVSKESGKITFIPKTIAGDKGEAQIYSEKKGVAFARMMTLSEPSSLRVKPVCPHFDSCPSCHYLHIEYEQELLIKKENLERLCRKLPIPPVSVVPAIRRLGYRNRIQLHYDLKNKNLGMLDQQGQKIVKIPACLMGIESVGEEVRRLYKDDNWMNEAPKNPNSGHVEIYHNSQELKVSWNKPYADGGFTQVFKEMNQKLIDLIGNHLPINSKSDLLDLFGGNGNLSSSLSYSKRLCVDIYPQSPGGDFFNQNLYESNALKSIMNELNRRDFKIETLLLDPPRSGFKDFAEWLKAINPKTVGYVSCDPHTLVRDMMLVSEYVIKKIFLIDFFPSTFHYETFIILERKS